MTEDAPSGREAAFEAWHRPFLLAVRQAPGSERYTPEDWRRMESLIEKVWNAAWAARDAQVARPDRHVIDLYEAVNSLLLYRFESDAEGANPIPCLAITPDQFTRAVAVVDKHRECCGDIYENWLQDGMPSLEGQDASIPGR